MKSLVSHQENGSTGECLGLHLFVWCPGCRGTGEERGELHQVTFRCPEHGGPTAGPVWDGDPYSDPVTFSPSYLLQGEGTCHSFVREGVWEYLDDCTHPLAGQHVPVPDLPDWVTG